MLRRKSPYLSWRQLYLALASATLLQACGGSNAPLDADTRLTIDSTANAQINRARIELDSLCGVAERTQMAHLVDSIKKVRIMEIEKQLKSVPK
jgi:hypothetical protein